MDFLEASGNRINKIEEWLINVICCSVFYFKIFFSEIIIMQVMRSFNFFISLKLKVFMQKNVIYKKIIGSFFSSSSKLHC